MFVAAVRAAENSKIIFMKNKHNQIAGGCSYCCSICGKKLKFFSKKTSENP
jgi:hypothetical protein